MAVTRKTLADDFEDTYRNDLRGIDPRSRVPLPKERIAAKHAGFAIFRFLAKSSDLYKVELFEREKQFSTAMRESNLFHFLDAEAMKQKENILSRMHFAVITNIKTSNRFIVDLGSVKGTKILDATQIAESANYLPALAEGREFFSNVLISCQSDSRHRELYPDFNKLILDKLKTAISKTAEITCALPADEIDLLLETSTEKFDWAVLPNIDMIVEIDCLQFKLSKNLKLTLITDTSMPAPEASPIHALQEIESLPLSSQSAASLFSTTMQESGNSAIDSLIDLPSKPYRLSSLYHFQPAPEITALEKFNALVAKLKKEPETNSNYALKNAIQEIEEKGGADKCGGNPESFKCLISHQQMVLPLIDECGHSYEGAEIVKTEMSRSPLTGQTYTANNKFVLNTDLIALQKAFFEVYLLRNDAQAAPLQTMRYK